MEQDVMKVALAYAVKLKEIVDRNSWLDCQTRFFGELISLLLEVIREAREEIIRTVCIELISGG